MSDDTRGTWRAYPEELPEGGESVLCDISGRLHWLKFSTWDKSRDPYFVDGDLNTYADPDYWLRPPESPGQKHLKREASRKQRADATRAKIAAEAKKKLTPAERKALRV